MKSQPVKHGMAIANLNKMKSWQQILLQALRGPESDLTSKCFQKLFFLWSKSYLSYFTNHAFCATLVWKERFQLMKILGFLVVYRVYLKFSYTWNELFVVNWFISKFFWGNTKWKKVSSLHYLKVLNKLNKHGLSYSLKRKWF